MNTNLWPWGIMLLESWVAIDNMKPRNSYRKTRDWQLSPSSAAVTLLAKDPSRFGSHDKEMPFDKASSRGGKARKSRGFSGLRAAPANFLPEHKGRPCDCLLSGNSPFPDPLALDCRKVPQAEKPVI